MSTVPTASPRDQQRQQWAAKLPAEYQGNMSVASADASFRQYFRISGPQQSYILMDAPPDKEDVKPFLQVTQTLREARVAAPQIFAEDIAQGFLLLEDFGNQPLLNALTTSSVDQYYAQSLDALRNIQQASCAKLPAYDQALLQREMDLFSQWYLQQQLKLSLNANEQQSLQTAQQALIDSALEQPQVFVHRDYHSRNLMITDSGSIGIIDYQDAVQGAITYDLVSLLRDCYIAWPRAQVEDWALGYLRQQTFCDLTAIDDTTLLRWFDHMGAQRHIKVLGIFSRLNLRDGKPGYLKDMPRILDYLLDVAQRYEKLQPLLALADNHALIEKTQALAT